MHYLTTEEQERLAYAEGYTETAAVLARLDDAHRALGDEAAMQAQIDDLQDTINGLRDERDKLRDQLHNVMSERELAIDQTKSLRAALMAIESVVSPGMREFIREVLQ